MSIADRQKVNVSVDWRWDEVRQRFECSKEFLELYRLPEDTPTNLDACLRRIHPDDRASAVACIETLRSGETTCACELRILDEVHGVRWIHREGRAFRDAQGRLLRIDGFDLEITLERLTSSALNYERDRISKLAESLPGVLHSFRLNPDDTASMPYASPHAKSILGFTPEELAEDMRLAMEHIHPDDLPGLMAARAQSARDLTTLTVEFRIHVPGQGERWIRTDAAPMREDDGATVWHGVLTDVTRLKQEELRLRIREEQLQLLIDHAPISLAMFDRQMRYLAASRRWIAAYGLEGVNLRNRSHYETFPGMPESWKQIYARGLAGEVITSDMDRYEHDGRVQWLRWEVHPWHAPGGQVAGIVVFTDDITERKNAEDRVRESEVRFRAVTEGLPDPLFVHDDRGHIFYCNPSAAESLGYTQEELLRLEVLDFDGTYSVEAAQELWDRQIAAKPDDTPYTFETVHCRKDGSRFPVEVRISVIPWKDKRVFLATVRDLTFRNSVEAELRDKDSLLEETAELANIRGWIFDPANRSITWSESAVRMTKRIDDTTPEAVLGLSHLEVEDQKRLSTAMASAIAAGTPFDLEVRNRSGAGQLKFLRVICRPIIERGKVKLLRGSIQDLTDRKELEERFLQAQKMDAVGRLAGGIAHDFNNLLTVIHGYCDVTLAKLPHQSELRLPVTAIQAAAERATGLTSQLLAFSRKAIVTPRVINLRDLIADSRKLMARLIGEDIRVSLISLPGPTWIKADPNQIDQVIMNLAVNARDAMPHGGALTFESGYDALREMVLLRVSDTGCGMSEEVKSKIFEPFFTTKGKGTGLGLGVVDGVVQQAGGYIEVESGMGAGTTFRIYFPAVPAPAPAIEPLAKPVEHGSETILLVEDDDEVRELCKSVLMSKGYMVLDADGSSKALDILEKARDQVDMLITDVVMPEMSGRELANAVREHCPSLHVIFVSGYTDDAVMRHGISHAQDDFMQKPFSPLSLARKVREVFDRVARSS